ncbi:hypothetical protein KAR91_08635 [Candidatus Pacearchaeota archaeon]|nr:hypothetical protein [Candidatus Pacearchaeota archaeon]
MKTLNMKVWKVWNIKGSTITVRASGFEILTGGNMIGFYVEEETDFKSAKTYFKWFSIYNIISIEINDE